LKSYLTEADIDADTLIRWCQGLDLPLGFQQNGEPFRWIIGGFPVGRDEPRVRRHIAEQAALVLRDRPDERPAGRRPEMLLYNLLKLCGELNCPDELFAELRQMYRREALKGRTYQGVPLWDILLHALAYNQLDNKLESDWRAILEKPSGVPRYSAFAGSVMMPRSEETRGEPYVDAIGYALKWMAVELESNHNRREQFHGLLREAKETYPGWPEFDKEMVEEANRHEWSKWSRC
jgi:hypothetical protein